MKFRIAFVLASMAVGVSMAHAEPEFLDVITKKYNIDESSALGAKSCGICHVSDEDYKFNPYGKQVGQYLTEHNLSKVDDAVLGAVGGLDADGDGVSNDAELAAGTDPGKSDKPGAASVETPSAPEPPKPLVPKNGFHPAIVHFPIALLIAGLMFDFVGVILKQRTLLYAGWYNLVLSTFSALGGIASGFLAITLLKVPYKGMIFNHMLLALATTFVMFIMVILRVHQHDKMTAPTRVLYYLLALAAFVMISWTGHLGGAFVYGE